MGGIGHRPEDVQIQRGKPDVRFLSSNVGPLSMQQLFIMRHGEALFDAPDPQRSLSERGHRQAAETSQWLAEKAAGRDVRLLASPFTRAQQTAHYVAQALNVSIESQLWLTPDTPVAAVMAGWDALWMTADDAQCWVWVSHMPLVGYLGRYLTEGKGVGSDAFATAEVVQYEADVWAAGCAYTRSRYRPQS